MLNLVYKFVSSGDFGHLSLLYLPRAIQAIIQTPIIDEVLDQYYHYHNILSSNSTTNIIVFRSPTSTTTTTTNITTPPTSHQKSHLPPNHISPSPTLSPFVSSQALPTPHIFVILCCHRSQKVGALIDFLALTLAAHCASPNLQAQQIHFYLYLHLHHHIHLSLHGTYNLPHRTLLQWHPPPQLRE